MSTSWTGVEDAIRTWVLGSSGLDNAHVIWDTPNAGRPTATFISLRMGDMQTLGIDELTGSDTPGGGTPGASDYTLTVTSRRRFTVTIQCFAPPVSGHLGPKYGDNGATAILSRVQASLALPSVIDALAAVSCSSFDPGSLAYIPESVGTAFEGRARFEAHFYGLETVSATTTYIAAVTPIGITFTP